MSIEIQDLLSVKNRRGPKINLKFGSLVLRWGNEGGKTEINRATRLVIGGNGPNLRYEARTQGSGAPPPSSPKGHLAWITVAPINRETNMVCRGCFSPFGIGTEGNRPLVLSDRLTGDRLVLYREGSKMIIGPAANMAAVRIDSGGKFALTRANPQTNLEISLGPNTANGQGAIIEIK